MATILIILGIVGLFGSGFWLGVIHGKEIKADVNVALNKVKTLSEARETLLTQVAGNLKQEILEKIDTEIHNALDEVSMLKSKALTLWQKLRADVKNI